MSNFESDLQSAFETRVPGKWVLCGEHAVLRGAPAVALPHPELSLSLAFRPGGATLEVSPAASREAVLGILRERGALPRGELRIEASVPVGAGLGSSAALCVALARWFAPDASAAEVARAATELEHRFHGRSSGMDAAVIAAGRPVWFTRGEAPAPLAVDRLPRFTFHDSGRRAATRDCVAQVDAFHRAAPAEAARVDQVMAQASRDARAGLERRDLAAVAGAMRAADGCFASWGLIPEEARALQGELAARGALATKLTGAGGGGFVVALWAS